MRYKSFIKPEELIAEFDRLRAAEVKFIKGKGTGNFLHKQLVVPDSTTIFRYWSDDKQQDGKPARYFEKHQVELEKEAKGDLAKVYDLWRQHAEWPIETNPYLIVLVIKILGAQHMLEIESDWGEALLAALATDIKYSGPNILDDMIKTYKGNPNNFSQTTDTADLIFASSPLDQGIWTKLSSGGHV